MERSSNALSLKASNEFLKKEDYGTIAIELLEEKKWRFRCEREYSDNPECCVQHCLSLQVDFTFQRSASQKTLLRHKLLFDLYPKFHCEYNRIERYSADVRKNWDCSFEGLEKQVPIALDHACPSGKPPTNIRRNYKRCFRYIEAYDRGMDAWAADEEVKNHRQEVHVPLQARDVWIDISIYRIGLTLHPLFIATRVCTLITTLGPQSFTACTKSTMTWFAGAFLALVSAQRCCIMGNEWHIR